MESSALQIKAAWCSKIEHIISKPEVNDEVHCNDRDQCQHMFTYPFQTVDNSLQKSCIGLVEFSHHSGIDGVHDAVYEKSSITSSIIIGKKLVGFLTPGRKMDNNIINFCLSW